MKLDLTGGWLFKNVKHDEWFPATVPGCNYLDLLELGLIPDPFYGTNEKDVYWVGLDDWEYRKNFHVSIDELKSDSIKLVCEMLDSLRYCADAIFLFYK